MDANKYCEEKLNLAGSDLYYSCLGLDKKQRQGIVAIHALAKEILTIPYECQEESVARKKIAWWQEQIEHLYQNNAQHPVMKVLQNYKEQLPQPIMEELIAGATNTLIKHDNSDESNYFVYCYQQQGATQLLCAHLQGISSVEETHFCNHLGIALQTSYLIRSLRYQIQQGKLYFPNNHLAQFKLTFEDFTPLNLTDHIKDFLAHEHGYCKQHINKALEKLPKKHKQRHGQLIAKLALKNLNEIAREGYQVFTQDTQITPLRKLLTVWF